MANIVKHSGAVLDLSNLQKDNFDINDFAYTLSGVYKYGASAKRYTVAEHCLRGSYFIKDSFMKLYFLLHEGCTGITGIDVTDEVKLLLQDYQQMELQLNKFVIAIHGLTYVKPYPAKIIEIDKILSSIEKAELFTDTYYKPLSSETAKKYYVKRYWQLIQECKEALISQSLQANKAEV